jgi:FtsH-binding integral membrane protein
MDGKRIDRSSMFSGFTGEFSPSFDLIMNKFFISLFISLIGTVVGAMLIPRAPGLYFVAAIAEFIMIIAAVFLRMKSRVSYGFVYAYTFLSGFTLFPILGYYVASIGIPLVASAVIITTVAFGGLAFYGYTTKRNLSFLSSILFIGLIVLVGFSLVGIFVPGINVGISGLLIASAGIIIFSGYTILDMNMYARYMRSEADLPWCVLALFLDYINLLLYVLRILRIFAGRD